MTIIIASQDYSRLLCFFLIKKFTVRISPLAFFADAPYMCGHGSFEETTPHSTPRNSGNDDNEEEEITPASLATLYKRFIGVYCY